MADNSWKEYFNKKVEENKGDLGSSDYFNEKSFYMQRENTLKWLGNLEGKVILDAGCGVGLFSEPLVKNNEVYGADFAEKALEYAGKRGLKTICGDITKLPVENDKFDVVICIGVIQLIEDHKKLIQELHRVTKPGGILLIETLNKHSLQRKIYMLVNRTKKFDKMYDKIELKKEFEAIGFKNVEFMNMYHPFSHVGYSDRDGIFTKYFSTSFAIKAVKG